MRKIINSATTQYEPVLTEELVLDDRPISGSFNGITSDAVYKAISVDPGNVPPVESTDNGKVLTASYGEGGGSFAWATPEAPQSELPAYSSTEVGKVLGVVADYDNITNGQPATILDWVAQGGGGSSRSSFDTRFELLNVSTGIWDLSNEASSIILNGSYGVYAYYIEADLIDGSSQTAIDDVYNVTVRVGFSDDIDTKAIGLKSDTPSEYGTNLSFRSSGILYVRAAQAISGSNVSVTIQPAKTAGGTALTTYTDGTVILWLAKLSTIQGGWQPES